VIEFLNALYSQIVYQFNHRSTKIPDLLNVLAALSNKKYKLPEENRQECKLKYYIL
jgi:hypothetical protein